MALPPDDPYLLAIGELRRLLGDVLDQLADILEEVRHDKHKPEVVAPLPHSQSGQPER